MSSPDGSEEQKSGMGHGRPRVLFVHIQKLSLNSFLEKDSFVGQDYRLLKRHYDVIAYQYNASTAGIRFVRWLLKNKKRFDIIYIWFGDIHATFSVLMAKMMRKKSIIVVGGYDTGYIPELKYGFLSKPYRYLFAWFHFTFADRIIVVDNSLRENIVKNVKIGDGNIETVMTSPDSSFWTCEKEKTQDIAITVGNINNMTRVRLKGIITMMETAKLLPEIIFEIIGVEEPALSELKKMTSPNVRLFPLVNKAELRKHYQDAKIYLQLSLSEGLGNALCEAMLCKCIPVGTHVGGIPTAIGDIGYYVPYGDAKATAEAIENALKSKKGLLARERIKNLSSPQIREKKLIKLIDSVYDHDHSDYSQMRKKLTESCTKEMQIK
jgi:glycosyltransferase involved in cell wall biosynthesis